MEQQAINKYSKIIGKGLVKMTPVVSIITVCYNAEKTIGHTIQSVLEQSFFQYEYIIVDGKSMDRTNDIIRGFLPYFVERGINVEYISEKDDGIYYAMNKGINMASGKWIAFMNADDSFYDRDVLKDVFEEETYEEYDVIYGDTNCISARGEEIKTPLNLDIMRNEMIFVHQSSFVKTEIMKSRYFNTNFNLAADYQFFLELWLENYQFYYLKDRVFSNFSTEGASNKKAYETITEVRKIRCTHDIPGTSKWRTLADYIWWIGVHLGGKRIKKK